MTASPFSFPGERTLTGWWRQLAPHQPRALVVAHFLLHQLDASVITHRAEALDRLTRLILEAIAQSPGQPGSQLADRLQIQPQFLRRALRMLQEAALAEAGPNGTWQPTPAGQDASRTGVYPRRCHERRHFYFLHRAPAPPRFLPLTGNVGEAWQVHDGWHFDPAELGCCVAQPPEWKTLHGFPANVDAIESPQSTASPLEQWRQMLVDTPRHLSAVLLTTAENRLLFPFRQEGWRLDTAHPLLILGPNWREILPELAVDPAPEKWHQAWCAWGHTHGLAGAEIESCQLERRGHELLVQAPPALADRLRSGTHHSEEIWLLAGEANLRHAARVEVRDLA